MANVDFAVAIAGTAELAADVIGYARANCTSVTPALPVARILAVDLPVAVVIRVHLETVAELEVPCDLEVIP